VAGLKKEQKKLAKALKAHRKRLDILVESAADPADRVVLADLVQELEQLNTVLSGLSTQRKTKATQSKQSAETCCKECGGGAQQEASSSSSESEDDCVDVQAPSAVAVTSVKARVNALVVHSMGSSVTLDVPEIVDFDTPAPVYSGAGIISVCQGSKCQGQGAVQVLQQVSQLGSRSEQVEVMPCKCLGRCGKAPAMRVKAAGQPCAVYTHVTPASAKFVLDRHFASQQEQQAAAAASEGQGERLLA
jgi:(2Fe-2S) ferredoxin